MTYYVSSGTLNPTHSLTPSHYAFLIPENYGSAGCAFRISWLNAVCVCMDVCLDVNQGETNRNRCKQRFVILHAQTY